MSGILDGPSALNPIYIRRAIAEAVDPAAFVAGAEWAINAVAQGWASSNLDRESLARVWETIRTEAQREGLL